MATSRRADPPPQILKNRRDTAWKLLELHHAHKAVFEEMERLEAELKQYATNGGESFREDFGPRGYVSASGAVAAEFKGQQPVIQTEAWLKLKKAEQNRLVKEGLVKVEEQWGRRSSGRVQVKAL